MAVEKQFENEVRQTVEDVNNAKGDFKFAVVADSHLDNSLDMFMENISAVDNGVNFDCMLHLGDFLNGSFPRRYAEKILKQQIKMYESAVKCGFYPTEGNHDGFADFKSPKTYDIAPDDMWEGATGRKPCYYVDFSEKKIRFVCICSYHYKYDGANFEKVYGSRIETSDWLYNEALNVDSEWTVILFSHDVPFSGIPVADVNNIKYQMNGKELFEAVLRAKKEREFDIAGWFIGHFHDDFEQNISGVNFILVSSQTAYVPTLWGALLPERYGKNFENYKRELGDVTEDLWDAVVLDKKERKLKLFRFGAGFDRVIDY